MELVVINTENAEVGRVTVPDEIFAAEINDALLWEQVNAQRASKRRGTHATRTRAMVSGGGIKPFKQKGGGRARQGSIRAPNHVGGGKVFGPHPRDYSYRLPKAARKAALRSVLSLKVKEQKLFILEDFSLAAPKTARVVDFLQLLGNPKTLIVDSANPQLKLSTRNLLNAKFLEDQAFNVYDVLAYEKLVLTQRSLPQVIAKALKPVLAAGEVA